MPPPAGAARLPAPRQAVRDPPPHLLRYGSLLAARLRPRSAAAARGIGTPNLCDAPSKKSPQTTFDATLPRAVCARNAALVDDQEQLLSSRGKSWHRTLLRRPCPPPGSGMNDSDVYASPENKEAW